MSFHRIRPFQAALKAQAVREKLEQLGITEQDVEDAVAWARQ